MLVNEPVFLLAQIAELGQSDRPAEESADIALALLLDKLNADFAALYLTWRPPDGPIHLHSARNRSGKVDKPASSIVSLHAEMCRASKKLSISRSRGSIIAAIPLFRSQNAIMGVFALVWENESLETIEMHRQLFIAAVGLLSRIIIRLDDMRFWRHGKLNI